MIRNIPMKCSQQTLLERWAPDGSYDFLYVPFSFERKKNLGYGFINFVAHELAAKFIESNQGAMLPGSQSRKPLECTWAEVQGRNSNLQQFLQYKIARIKNIHWQPAIFEGTERVDFREYMVRMQLDSKSRDASKVSSSGWSSPHSSTRAPSSCEGFTSSGPSSFEGFTPSESSFSMS